MKKLLINVVVILFVNTLILAQTVQYVMPEESALHEGTWLQWPHNKTYPPYFREDLEPTWIEMTRGLVTGEKVHIIAYDSTEYNHIIQALLFANVPLINVDFFIHPNNDCWVRDNGPVFVNDTNNNLVVLDWGFNGWGNATVYALCNAIPQEVSSDISIPRIDLNNVILEGGAVEIDGNGTLLATKSSILNNDRNPTLSQAQVENYMTTNLGVTNIIWLNGVPNLEITDMHIDGFVKFLDTTTIITMDSTDLTYWEVPANDINTLYTIQNTHGNTYNYIFLPLTANNVSTTWGQNLGYKGSYVNYYVGNNVVLVPTYNDPNDAVAIAILTPLYPSRTVIGIDVRNLYSNGGMVHCVTQQQPFNPSFNSLIENNAAKIQLAVNSPNPFSDFTTIKFKLEKNSAVMLEIYNQKGKLVSSKKYVGLIKGSQAITISGNEFKSGVYIYRIVADKNILFKGKMIVEK